MNSSLQVVIDVICPWCFIGKRRLDHISSAAPGAERPVVEWRPYELDPRMPAEGAEREAYRARRFGSVEKSRAMDTRARTAGKQVRIEFQYERITRTPNTLNAHRLIWLARKYDRQHAVVSAVLMAYFIEGKDIGDASVLADLAPAAGLDRSHVSVFLESAEGVQEVRDLIRQAEQKGIRTVPTALIGDVVLSNGIESIHEFINGDGK